MKTRFSVLVIAASFSWSANATVSFAEGEIVAQSGNSYSVSINDQTWSGVDASQLSKKQRTAWDRAQAIKANQKSIADKQAATDLQESQDIANYGTKTNSAGIPVNIVSMSTLTPATKPTINVAASTLSPATKVTTDKGIVTAGSLPKNTQVSVAFNSVFNAGVKGGNGHATSRSHGEHGTGNGANNAANSHSAHGLGGSESIGGGHSGGGFHY